MTVWEDRETTLSSSQPMVNRDRDPWLGRPQGLHKGGQGDLGSRPTVGGYERDISIDVSFRLFFEFIPSPMLAHTYEMVII